MDIPFQHLIQPCPLVLLFVLLNTLNLMLRQSHCEIRIHFLSKIDFLSDLRCLRCPAALPFTGTPPSQPRLARQTSPHLHLLQGHLSNFFVLNVPTFHFSGLALVQRRWSWCGFRIVWRITRSRWPTSPPVGTMDSPFVHLSMSSTLTTLTGTPSTPKTEDITSPWALRRLSKF